MQHLLSQPLVDTLKLSIKQRVATLVDDGFDPHLAVILVGEHEDSLRYISIKTRVAKELGIIVSLYHMEADSSYAQVRETIDYLNGDSEVHGIIIQLPLPSQFTSEQTDSLLRAIHPDKDVDGLGGAWEDLTSVPKDISGLLQPQAAFVPPMVSSVLSLLDQYEISLKDKKIVLIGKGRLVGSPLLTYFGKLGIDVTAVDEETPDIISITKQADILISGTGDSGLVTYQWIKEGATVIDCAADIHEDSVSQVAAALAPSTGGVGPLTVIWLLHNTLQACLATKQSS